jgi:hypothetical protein
MSRFLKLSVVAWATIACALFASALPSIASSAEVTFQMQNNHPNAVEVELYSQDRADYVWPGNGEVYILDDGETKTMPISCKEGEKICYGAWIQGDKQTYWGVGPGNGETCDDCCYTCTGGNTEVIELTE